MKRRQQVITKLLEWLRARESAWSEFPETLADPALPGELLEPAALRYHIDLCEQAGFVEVRSGRHPSLRLTWKGHEPLCAASGGEPPAPEHVTDFPPDGPPDLLTQMRRDLKQLLQRVPAAPAALVAGSPLRLSDFGRQIADRLDVDVWAAGLAPAIAAELKGKRPFEIDEFCRAYVQHRLHRDWADRIAECAYELGIGRPDVLSVMRVVLRDQLLGLAGPAE